MRLDKIIFVIGILMFCAGSFMEAFHYGEGSYVVGAGVVIGLIAIFMSD